MNFDEYWAEHEKTTFANTKEQLPAFVQLLKEVARDAWDAATEEGNRHLQGGVFDVEEYYE